jgi:hypothetical protein
MKVAGGLLLLAAVLVAVATGLTGSAEGQGPGAKVLVSTTGNRSELVDTVPITRNSGDEKRVVVSMPPRELPSLTGGDRLEMSAELQVTPDCRARGPHCVVGPYRYAPVATSRLILTDGRRDTGGRDAVAISGRKRTRCPHSYDNFVHHCRIVFRRESLDVSRRALPCSAERCRVNFVLGAHSRRARASDRLIIGANGATGQVVQDKARLNAVRFSPGNQPSPPTLTTRRRTRKRVSLREARTVVLSRRLPALGRNEQLAVSSRVGVDVSHLPYDARVSVRLLLASEPRAATTSRRVEREASMEGDITELSGSNCTQRGTPCRYPGAGVLTMRRDAFDGPGERAARFVNLVIVANPKFDNAQGGHRLRVLRGSSLRVVRFPAELRG